MTVADRIRKLREEYGWTQDDLAHRCGYASKTAISKIETSGDDITQKKIVRCAKALNTTSAYLMGWTENKIDIEEELAAEEDFELLQKYNKLSDKNKQIVLTLIDSLLSAQ